MSIVSLDIIQLAEWAAKAVLPPIHHDLELGEHQKRQGQHLDELGEGEN